MAYANILILCVSLFALLHSVGGKIIQISPCKAQIDGKIINLEPLQRLDGIPRFAAPHNDWNFTFNPCHSYDDPEDRHEVFGDQCHHVAACKKRWGIHGREYFTAGIQRASKFKKVNNTYALRYRGLKSHRHSVMYILLICDQHRVDVQDAIFKSAFTKNHKSFFYLRHLCACLDGCVNEAQATVLHSIIEPVQLSPCKATVRGRLINLEPLQGTTTPRFRSEFGGWNFTFNPCHSYNEPLEPHTGGGEKCHHVAICKSRRHPKTAEYYTAGIQRSASFRRVNNSIAIKYKGIRSYKSKLTYIHLRCDPTKRTIEEASFEVKSYDNKSVFMELSHVCCCPNGCLDDVFNQTAMNLQQKKAERRTIALFAVAGMNAVLIFIAVCIAMMCHNKHTSLTTYKTLPGDSHVPKNTKSTKTIPLDDQDNFDNLFSDSRPRELMNYVEKRLDFTRHQSIHKSKLLPVLEDCVITLKELDLGQRLGGGLYGDTYAAEWRDRKVALKRITAGIHKNRLSEDEVQWMNDEISYLSRQRHKNVVAVIGICFEAKQPYIVSEYVEGKSMRELLIDQGDNLQWPYKVNLCIQAAEGLNFLHSAKKPILHRDLRCANLMVDKNDLVKVGDFGVVRLIQPLRRSCKNKGGCHCRRKWSACPESIRWTSPEVLASPKAEPDSDNFTAACDVYSFGIIMWQMVARADPFSEINDEKEVVELIKGGIRPMFPPGREVMYQYRELIEECWHQTPKHRPKSRQVVHKLKELSHQTRAFQKSLEKKTIQPGSNLSLPVQEQAYLTQTGLAETAALAM